MKVWFVRSFLSWTEKGSSWRLQKEQVSVGRTNTVTKYVTNKVYFILLFFKIKKINFRERG